MAYKTKNLIGLIVGVAWFVTVITVGWQIFQTLAARYGDTFGAFSLFYLLAALAVLFTGRAVLENVLVNLLNLDNDSETTWLESVESSDVTFEVPTAQFGARAACTINVIGFHVDTSIEYERDGEIFDTSASVKWVTD